MVQQKKKNIKENSSIILDESSGGYMSVDRVAAFQSNVDLIKKITSTTTQSLQKDSPKVAVNQGSTSKKEDAGKNN